MAQEEKSADPLSHLRSLPEHLEDMITTANKIVAEGKGILAADESTGTIGNRFKGINVENTEENRRRYRQLLFDTPGLSEFIGGAILYEETLLGNRMDGNKDVPLIKALQEQGIEIGIKVDMGALPLPLNPRGTFTQGLTGLDTKKGGEKGRAERYYEAGARFAKWRATLKIVNGYVAQESINETAWTLARYAAICQKWGLVPIVEPELLMDGNHSLEVCQYWTEKIIKACYKALSDQEVVLEATLLKPNMCLTGADVEKQNKEANALATAQTLLRAVPAAVPGIVFLSGGQSEQDASLLLDAINRLNEGKLINGVKFPWAVSFSYGRALQASCLKKWLGKDENIKDAQDMLTVRARANRDAALGQYDGQAASLGGSLYEKGYDY